MSVIKVIEVLGNSTVSF